MTDKDSRPKESVSLGEQFAHAALIFSEQAPPYRCECHLEDDDICDAYDDDGDPGEPCLNCDHKQECHDG